MIIEGTALVIAQDDVDTDVIFPGAYLNVLDTREMARYLFEGLDAGLRERIVPGTILVVGDNFGSGSSREQAATAMQAAGITCVVAKSFARIFHRNCINLGLPAIPSPEAAAAARDGSAVRVDPEAGEVEVDGERYPAPVLPPFMLELLEAGGLVPWIGSRR